MPEIQIDLRSDTVTKPSPEMREAMFRAEVGDDVYGEDPTINRLEQRIAEITGKAAALYVPSGTMSNQVAVKTLTQPGQEIICEENCHIYNYEAAGTAFNSLVQVRPLRGQYGVLDAAEVEAAIRPADIHAPQTALITVENTHNRSGGTVYPIEAIRELYEVARRHQIAMHLDGARLFNAVVQSGISAKEYCEYFDSVSICFSKGLGAPVGSALLGTFEFIQRARKYRKLFGGGMRQAGILAAACLYALNHNIDRLAEDHRNARRLAEGIHDLPGIEIDDRQVQTNMVMIRVVHPRFEAASLCDALREKGIGASAVDRQRIRAVTHLDVSAAQIDEVISILKIIVNGVPS